MFRNNLRYDRVFTFRNGLNGLYLLSATFVPKRPVLYHTKKRIIIN